MASGLGFESFCLQELGMTPGAVRRQIETWLEEDYGSGDLTIKGMGSLANGVSRAEIIAKQQCTVAGVELACEIFRVAHGFSGTDSPFRVLNACTDGASLEKNDVIVQIEGLASALLIAERSALNLFAKLCGIATQTRRILTGLEEASKGGRCPQLLETRKTTPGLRVFEKFATRIGGARNHRMSLDTGAMLKENHFHAARQCGASFDSTMSVVLERLPLLSQLEVEVTNLEEFDVALSRKVAVIMLDNFSPDDMAVALSRRNQSCPSVKIEVSGNLDRLDPGLIARCGADYVSMGALVHQATWTDLSLRFVALPSLEQGSR